MAKQKQSDEAYDKHKQRVAKRGREMAASGREIGELPAVVNPERRAACERDLGRFLVTYFPETFFLQFGKDHHTVIAKAQAATLEGGLFALAMPRSSGKTNICKGAVLWAVLYGHRCFAVLVGAESEASLEMLQSLKTDIESNELLGEDFPEVCFPIRALEGINHRCSGQTYQGVRTCINWSGKSITLPTIHRSKASGAVIHVTGIMGRIRGMNRKRVDGVSIRPDLVVVDDPQTDDKAISPIECRKRVKILTGAILGLAGPNKKISGIMPCTVIAKGDMADQILDREQHPEWSGERMKMVYEWPKNQELWDKYAEIRLQSLAEHNDIRLATEFYRANREQMDAGSVVAWPARFYHDEISAIQHAWNLRLRDADVFFAEYQNEPRIQGDGEDLVQLVADEVVAKLNNIERGNVPIECNKLTAFVDVHENCLYWMVCGWNSRFGGSVVDYGTWPNQPQAYFRLVDAAPTLQQKYPGRSMEAAIFAGLRELYSSLLSREWPRSETQGGSLKVEKLITDANWGESTDTVYQAIREHPMRTLLLPSHGHGITASGRAMAEWTKKEGEDKGRDWILRPSQAPRFQPSVTFDTNSWKSFLLARLRTPAGGIGSLSICQRLGTDCRLLADHLTAEHRVQTGGRGRLLEEWRARPGKPDNHWFDCAVGCAVAASVCGVQWSAGEMQETKKPVRIKLSEIYGAKKKRRE